MDLIAALGVLGVEPGTPMAEVRDAYRSAIRRSHPDVATDGTDAHAATALLTEAWAVVSQAGTTRPQQPQGSPHAAPSPPDRDHTAVAATASDTIGVAAPPDETFALLHEAAGQVGEIAYVDRNLGILEAIVRFEGGPSCSLLVTLQGRSWGTEAFCTLESIEAAPTPSIAPVMEALLEALGA